MKRPKHDKMVRPGDYEDKFTTIRWRWNGEKFIPVMTMKKRKAAKRLLKGKIHRKGK